MILVDPCERGGARQSCRVTLRPEARDAIVLLSVLEILCCDAAYQGVRCGKKVALEVSREKTSFKTRHCIETLETIFSN